MDGGGPSTDSAALSTEIEFENDIKQHPYTMKYWFRYLQFKHSADAKTRNQLHERALANIPGSYKIWFQYLTERVAQVRDRPLDDINWTKVNNLFERALVFMSKMPRIWVEYIKFLMQQSKLTDTRRVVDRALQTLPITQHERVWKVATEFIKQDYVPVETAIRIWRRYLQVEPYLVEDFIIYLRKHQRWNDIINLMIESLNDPKFTSTKGRTRHELWVELCGILSRQGDALRLDNTSLTVDRIIRSGIKKYPNEVGQLWCALADYNIRCRHFDKARDVFEEGITTVNTVKDFSQIFDSYLHFEESLIDAKMEQIESGGAESDDGDAEDPYTPALLRVTDVDFDLDTEVEFRMKRLEHLMDRRPELLNSVLLRQNPHNVHEWHNRVKIFKNKPEAIARTYTEAIKTVDLSKAIGKPHTLYTNFARFYEERGALNDARAIFTKAVQERYRAIDDLATVWCEWAELELRNKKYKRALEVLKKATATNFTGQGSWAKDPTQPVQEKVWRSVRIWTFYADLNEQLCTLRSCKNVYDRMLYLKVATPQIVLHFANFLKENNFWEEAFKVYQQGITLFQWPQVHDIWVAYLSTFVGRFKGKKVERTRDLFEQCVAKVPKKHAARFYLMYARFEEKYGLARHCLAVYNAACQKVPKEELLEMYRRYIKVARKFFGAIRTREVREKAIQAVEDKEVPGLCLEWAELEQELGEIDRARSLYNHAAQYVDPRKENTFWEAWKAFEEDHGNEDTYRALLRVERSIKAMFASQVDISEAVEKAREARKKLQEAEAEAAGAATGGPAKATAVGADGKRASKFGAAPDAEGIKFVPQSASVTPEPGSVSVTPPPDADVEEIDIEERAVPEGVFGGMKRSAEPSSQLAKRVKTE